MSSLAAAQADGYYRPPEYDPQKHGSISKFAGSKGANQWEQSGVIRFELPYHSWCDGCGRSLGKGTRFNAKKDKVGKYYTTTIHEFKFNCPSCKILMVMKTDPENRDYAFVQGIRKRIQEYDAEDDTMVVEDVASAVDKGTSSLSVADPMDRLSHSQADKRKAETNKERLTQLEEWSSSIRRDDYDANAALRRALRGDKREDKQREEAKRKRGLHPDIPMAEEQEHDVQAARGVQFQARSLAFGRNSRSRLSDIHTHSIFGGTKGRAKGKSHSSSSRQLVKAGGKAMKAVRGGVKGIVKAGRSKGASLPSLAAKALRKLERKGVAVGELRRNESQEAGAGRGSGRLKGASEGGTDVPLPPPPRPARDGGGGGGGGGTGLKLAGGSVCTVKARSGGGGAGVQAGAGGGKAKAKGSAGAAEQGALAAIGSTYG